MWAESQGSQVSYLIAERRDTHGMSFDCFRVSCTSCELQLPGCSCANSMLLFSTHWQITLTWISSYNLKDIASKSWSQIVRLDLHMVIVHLVTQILCVEALKAGAALSLFM